MERRRKSLRQILWEKVDIKRRAAPLGLLAILVAIKNWGELFGFLTTGNMENKGNVANNLSPAAASMILICSSTNRSKVHAFDPSPISTEWAKTNLKDVPNYTFHPYGAGGKDGVVKLYKYNWGQVSQVRLPMYTDRWRCLNPEAIRHRP